MNTARTATLLTVLFTVLCILQISRIAQTLDTTRADLSSRSTGAINSLTQIDRNLDSLMYALLTYRQSGINEPGNIKHNDVSNKINTSALVTAYRKKFEIFWASVTVLKLRTPGEEELMPAAAELRAETQGYLDTYDLLVNGQDSMTNDEVSRMYDATRTLSDKYHDLSHDYFLALSEFSDKLKNRTTTLYTIFLALAGLALLCGTVSLYSLFRANAKSQELIERSNATQLRLTQAVDELRSGKLESKAKDSFLAAASHDLRQPLHALGLFIGALEKHVNPTGQAIMEKVQESNSALTKLLSSLLDLSRLDAGAVKVQRRNINIGKLISTLESEFQATATLRGMKLYFDKTEHIVNTDRILIDRVLRNLIENALTHSHGTCIDLACSVSSGSLVLTIADNGKGIPKAEQDDIFSEYYQIGNPERDRMKGLGIGLAIVNRLSKLLELNLQLHSSHRAGCTFTFSLPLSANRELEAPQAGISTSLAAPSRHTIIGVIEDEQGVRDGTEVMLQSKGYTTIAADSAQSLLQLLKNKHAKPDVLISDYRLRKGSTGDDAIREVLHSLRADIPSVIITGDTSPKRVKELTSGGFKLMHKPVEPHEMLAMINELIDTAPQKKRSA